jgi:hypothetical protein
VLLVVIALSIRASRCVVARPMPPWSLVLCLLVALGAGLWAGATHDEHVVLRRDAGSYALYGQQLAAAHQLPIRVDVPALGGPSVVDDPDVAVASPGFYRQGQGAKTTVVPQFLIGVPAWLSVGMWLGGWTGLLLVPAVFIALAIASVGALTATIGPRWAPIVALATACCQPVLHAARSTYSEPAALLALTAALTLLASSTEIGGRHPERSPRMALLAGLLLGGAGLVRPDALREVVLLVPVAVLLAVRRHAAARPVVIGAAVGTAVSAVAAVTLARPYLRLLAASLLPLAALGIVVSVAGAGLIWWLRRREAGRRAAGAEPISGPSADAADAAGADPRVVRAVPWVLAGLVLLTGVALATRPWWMVGQTGPHDASAAYVASLQRELGLPGNGHQTYAEHTVSWLTWWVGPAAALLALAGATLGAHRLGRQIARGSALSGWVGPLAIGLGSIVLTLWRPGITPDHPWADRRLVVSVLPGVLRLAAGAIAVLVRMARRHAPLPVLGLAVVVGAVALAGPALAATAPVAGLRTEMGEVAAVQQVCRTFHHGDVALVVGERAANEWPEVLRGVCHLPTAIVRVPHANTSTPAGEQQLADALARLVPKVQAGGGHVLLVSDRAELLAALGRRPALLVHLETREDPRLLTERPEGSVPLTIDLWSAPAAG